jgi:hypothetical protein
MYFCDAKPEIMDFKGRYRLLFQTCVSVLMEPNKFWKGEKEEVKPEVVFSDYFFPLVLLVGLAVFFGELIKGSEVLWSYAVAKSVREVISYILQFYLSIYLLNQLLTSAGGEKNKLLVTRLVAYSFLPFLIVSFLTGLFPGLYIISVLGLYGIFLFVQGVKGSLNIVPENQNRYTMLALLLIFLIFILLNVFSWKLLQAFYGYGA